MRKPSRNMPPYEPPNEPMGIKEWVFIIVMLSVLAFLVWKEPWTVLLIPLVYLASRYENNRRKMKLSILLEERKEKSICEFARSFEKHKVDTWVIRAVYEQIQEYVAMPGAKLPLEANDDIFDLLGIDSDDLEMDILEEIAQRTGRSLENTERNKFYGKVQTLEDLVLFLNEQPLVKTT
ncbi:MAG: hypothetical protein ABW098_00490 [Candidatus Thiodiazotropha sp.]